MSQDSRIKVSLFALRLTVFTVMMLWTIDKILNPGHAAYVFKHFYFISGINHQLFIVIGTLEVVLLVAFLLGIARFFTYGSVMIFHAVSTLSAYQQYLSPFEPGHLLFFAAWPMLAACFALFLLRKQDSLLTFGH